MHGNECGRDQTHAPPSLPIYLKLMPDATCTAWVLFISLVINILQSWRMWNEAVSTCFYEIGDRSEFFNILVLVVNFKT